MSITFSKEQSESVRITLENLFITEYMPLAPDSYVKVYLYGLSLAISGIAVKNATDEISKKLGLDIKLIEEAFRYWEGQELVNILDTIPMGIEYLAVKSKDKIIKKFKKEKYKTFNNQLHAMLPNRNFLPNEYAEYYNLIENYHIEIEAMLTIIAYCVRLKGESITYPYILAVAKNLAHDGCTTYERVGERLSELDLTNGDMGAIIKALKIKRNVDHDDRRLFIKWTKTLGFTLETIIYVAKQTKKGGMERLDALLTKYYENRLMDKQAIDAYNEKRDSMFSLAKEITRIIGVYYEQLDYIIETYINNWLLYGFSEKTLITVAEYSFRQNIRTLEGLNGVIKRFYQEGLLTLDSISSYINETLEIEKQIGEIMEKTGIRRKITSWDRDYYRTWTYSWGMPLEVILHSASLSKGKANPFSYMNSILSSYNENGIRSLEQAKKSPDTFSSKSTPPEIKSASRNYTNEEINAMFDRLKPEDI